jgi:hypothetical protein
MFYEISRDCMELFMAVIPTKFAQTLDASPRMGAVFFNDCLYIAHNSTLISHTYRQELGKINDKLIGCVGFVDFIPRYRAVGEYLLGKHIESQKQTISELVGRINLFTEVGSEQQQKSATIAAGIGKGAVRAAAGSMLVGGIQLLSNVLTAATNSPTTPSGPTFGSTAESAAKQQQAQQQQSTEFNDKKAATQLVKHFEWLRSQWQGVLQEAAYERIMSYLVESAIRAAMKPVLEVRRNIPVVPCFGITGNILLGRLHYRASWH